jgi:hypothetical protein
MEKTTKTTIITVDTYKLTPDINYVIEYVDGVENYRDLKYVGEKLNGYPLSPLYDVDLSVLQKTNPFWIMDEWFKFILPNPEDIDLSKIIYCQAGTHLFYDLNKEPISCVFKGCYIEAKLSNKYYDLLKLREHLLKHPKVVYVSDILNIPYYNCDHDTTKYLKVFVLADREIIKKGVSDHSYNHKIFGFPWEKDDEDYLDIKQFVIRNQY